MQGHRLPRLGNNNVGEFALEIGAGAPPGVIHIQVQTVEANVGRTFVGDGETQAGQAVFSCSQPFDLLHPNGRITYLQENVIGLIVSRRVVGPIKRQGYLAVEESQINHQGGCDSAGIGRDGFPLGLNDLFQTVCAGVRNGRACFAFKGRNGAPLIVKEYTGKSRVD